MTISPRIRRLGVDFEKMKEFDDRSPYMDIVETEGNPPVIYLVKIRVKGIIGLSRSEAPIYGYDHLVRITLGEQYPREKPVFEMMSKVWHPNIGWGEGALICIGSDGDHGWAPCMGLDDIVMRIMQMIRYENYSCDDYFNMLAAEWARKHENLFPVETGDLLEEIVDITIQNEDTSMDDDIVFL